MMAERIGAVVLAAGKGSRMNSEIPKQYLKVSGYPLATHCIAALDKKVDEIVLVAPPGEEEHCYEILVRPYGFSHVTKVVAGGAERFHSVYAGLSALASCDYVLIQDGARPCLSAGIIDRCIAGAIKYGACVAAVPVKDTIKEVSPEGIALRTPPRNSLYSIQTPQAFSFPVIFHAYEEMFRQENGTRNVTDDAMVVERFGSVPVCMAEGSYENIKVTTEDDLAIAQIYLDRMKEER